MGLTCQHQQQAQEAHAALSGPHLGLYASPKYGSGACARVAGAEPAGLGLHIFAIRRGPSYEAAHQPHWDAACANQERAGQQKSMQVSRPRTGQPASQVRGPLL